MAITILGTTDVALRLGCSAERVRQLEREGKLHAEKMPRGVRVFQVEDVERLAAERERQRQSKASIATSVSESESSAEVSEQAPGFCG
ncbi:MAG: MerR family transcriptional regulator [Blastocatellia bacterium]